MSEGGSKLGSAVGDNFVIETEAKVYLVEKECGNAFRGDVFLRGT